MQYALRSAMLLGSMSMVLTFTACKRRPTPTIRPATVDPGVSQGEIATPEPPGNPSTNRIKCGQEMCDVATQMCCGFSTDSRCAPRTPMGKGEQPEQRVQPMIKSCLDNIQSEYSFDTLTLCDDSTDCPDGQVCCSQWLWSGAAMLICMPADANGALACDYSEFCSGETCRTRDTHCVDNRCKRAGARVDCAGTICAEGTICCQRGFEAKPTCETSCEAASEEERTFEFECSNSSHCPPGATCQAGMFGSYCAKLLDTANASVLCNSDADCAPDGCAWMGKTTPPACKEGGPFKSCSCE